MGYLKLILMLSVSLLIAVNCLAILPDSLSFKGSYEQLRYHDHNGKVKKLYNADVGDSVITGYTTSTEMVTVPFEQISKLEYKTGSAGQKISLVTTCLGMVVGLGVTFTWMASESEQLDPDEDYTDVYMMPVYVCTVAGFLISAPFRGIGSKYKTLYDEKKQTGLNLSNLNLHFAMGKPSQKSHKYVGFSYRF